MQIALEKADSSLLLMSNAEGSYCLWPGDVAPPEGWRETLKTRDRVRFLGSLDLEMSGISPVTFVKQGGED